MILIFCLLQETSKRQRDTFSKAYVDENLYKERTTLGLEPQRIILASCMI